MLKKLGTAAVTALALSAGPVLAAGAAYNVENVDFTFDGPFGKYDPIQLQRGLKVYTEVCASCHGLKHVPIRTLHDKGGLELPEDQVRAYAELYEVFDPEIDDFRPARPTDHFPESMLENAPDLSLMAKKRAGFSGPYGLGINQFVNGIGGAEYIYSLLVNYEDPPACAPEDFPGDYNATFANGGYPESCKDENGHKTVKGSWISMAPPLWGEDVDYDDGAPNDLESVAEDVAAFLMWTAEPKMMQRKNAGFTGVIFLTILSVLLYLTNKRLWAPIKGKKNS
ncbi:cytochrome c1 [Roseovarius sp. LXJ103]|uniref:cytochrome c1 n=1 Tax=Roseovarius carneus TaxID=2853164 RepID=UPI000D60FCCC|nr:cytochrome c1 [Roseovarius carneus]MBZ8117507.1 cytochrome c1 [Roseovarius carneus]PWE36696.1 cytochrome c1 [Pelagicola sp. LXJ1103]